MRLSNLLIFESGRKDDSHLDESYCEGKFVKANQPKFGRVNITVQDKNTGEEYNIDVDYLSTWYGKYKHLESIEFSDKEFTPGEDNPGAYYDDISEKLLTSNELKFYFLKP